MPSLPPQHRTEPDLDALLRARYAAQPSDPEPAGLELVALLLDGAATPAQAREARALLAADPELAEAVALARAEAEARPVVSLADARRAREARRRPPPWGVLLAIAAALLVVVGVSLTGGGGPGDRTPDAPLASAGLGQGTVGDLLVVAVAHADGATPTTLRAGGPLPAPGDALVFEVAARRAGYLMVVVLAADGAVEVLYPSAGDAAAPLAPRPRGPLVAPRPLAAGPGCAWVVGLFADAPFTRADLGGPTAGAAAADCAVPDLGARWPFARTTVPWQVRR